MNAVTRSTLRWKFLEAFYLVIENEKDIIRHIVRKKLGSFPEAADLDNATNNCIADIERIITEQLNAPTKAISKRKERIRKLKAYREDNGYVKKYVLEATKSYCRKKQHYWGHAKNKPDIEKGETHKARKAGRAARVHGEGSANEVDDWITSIVTSELNMNSLQSDTIEKLDTLFKKIGLNNQKISCFWNRFNGMSFVEMAELDQKPNVSPDKYRKRFKRLITQLQAHSDEIRDILIDNLN